MALRAVFMAVSFTVEMVMELRCQAMNLDITTPFIHPNKVRMRC
jgi:hypothetical protein